MTRLFASASDVERVSAKNLAARKPADQQIIDKLTREMGLMDGTIKPGKALVAKPAKETRQRDPGTPRPNKQGSKGEEMLARQLELANMGEWKREFRFHPTRRWRVDFAWPDRILAVEIEGGTWTQGRHNRGKGFAEDCAKYNSLSLAGWRLLRFTPEMVKSGRALNDIQQALL